MTNPTQAQRDLVLEVYRKLMNNTDRDGSMYVKPAAQVLADHVAEEVAKANEWQPIETAPKDGHHVLLYRPNIQFVGYYAEAGWCMQGCQVIDPPPTYWRPLLSNPPKEYTAEELLDGVKREDLLEEGGEVCSGSVNKETKEELGQEVAKAAERVDEALGKEVK